MVKGDIPAALYRKIQASMPIACVDVILMTDKGVLLGKRTSGAWNGVWWLVGGRIRRGEGLEDAVARKVREETGLKAIVKDFVGAYTTIWTGKNDGRHSINFVFIAKIDGGILRMDRQHTDFKFVSDVKGELHPYIKQTLIDSGVFGRRKVSKQKDRYFVN